MIVVMRPEATPKEVEHVATLIREMGLKDHIINGTDLTVVAVIGDDRKKDKGTLEQAPGVDRVVPILAPYKMAAREGRKGRTVVPLGSSCTVGGKQVAVI